jgi:glycosyltransferase involved in cell wall biosynthesis
MKVCAITATKNRHTCLERSVRLFLNQTYDNCVQLIYNNACEAQRLNSNIPEGKIILVNNCLSKKTGKLYTTLGEIYNDILSHIPDDVDVVTFWDDDDVFFPRHIEKGVEGLLRGGKKAYKPQKSYYKSGGRATLVENTLEPSIFVKKDHLLQYGFSEETTAQHLQWLQPLLTEDQIYVDPNGESTLIYMWGEEIPVFKTSGDPGNPNNFLNYSNFSKDIGDQIITPISESAVQRYYLINNQ